MIEVNVRIYTDSDFVLDNTDNLLNEEYEEYSKKAFFRCESDAVVFIKKVFYKVNHAYDFYTKETVPFLEALVPYKDVYDDDVKGLQSAVYLCGNSKFTIEVIRHTKEWFEHRLNDIREEYKEIYGSYPAEA